MGTKVACRYHLGVEKKMNNLYPSTKESGKSIYLETINQIKSSSVKNKILNVKNGIAGEYLAKLLREKTYNSISQDLMSDSNWKIENWTIDEAQVVKPVSDEKFKLAEPHQLFSTNFCLRNPSKLAWRLRGFLAALTAKEVLEHFSELYNEKIRFISADITQYRKGHFLRRHQDEFDGRRFGMIWYFGKGWEHGFGGELFIEDGEGRFMTVSPNIGNVSILGFSENNWHGVAENKVDNWIRLSVAAHYGIQNT